MARTKQSAKRRMDEQKNGGQNGGQGHSSARGGAASRSRGRSRGRGRSARGGRNSTPTNTDVTHPDTPTRQIHTRASQPGSDTTQANTRSRPTGEFAHPTTAPTTQTNTLPNPVVVQQVNNTNTVGLTSTAATSATLAPPAAPQRKKKGLSKNQKKLALAKALANAIVISDSDEHTTATNSNGATAQSRQGNRFTGKGTEAVVIDCDMPPTFLTSPSPTQQGPSQLVGKHAKKWLISKTTPATSDGDGGASSPIADPNSEVVKHTIIRPHATHGPAVHASYHQQKKGTNKRLTADHGELNLLRKSESVAATVSKGRISPSPVVNAKTLREQLLQRKKRKHDEILTEDADTNIQRNKRLTPTHSEGMLVPGAAALSSTQLDPVWVPKEKDNMVDMDGSASGKQSGIESGTAGGPPGVSTVGSQNNNNKKKSTTKTTATQVAPAATDLSVGPGVAGSGLGHPSRNTVRACGVRGSTPPAGEGTTKRETQDNGTAGLDNETKKKGAIATSKTGPKHLTTTQDRFEVVEKGAGAGVQDEANGAVSVATQVTGASPHPPAAGANETKQLDLHSGYVAPLATDAPVRDGSGVAIPTVSQEKLVVEGSSRLRPKKIALDPQKGPQVLNKAPRDVKKGPVMAQKPKTAPKGTKAEGRAKNPAMPANSPGTFEQETQVAKAGPKAGHGEKGESELSGAESLRQKLLMAMKRKKGASATAKEKESTVRSSTPPTTGLKVVAKNSTEAAPNTQPPHAVPSDTLTTPQTASILPQHTAHSLISSHDRIRPALPQAHPGTQVLDNTGPAPRPAGFGAGLLSVKKYSSPSLDMDIDEAIESTAELYLPFAHEKAAATASTLRDGPTNVPGQRAVRLPTTLNYTRCVNQSQVQVPIEPDVFSMPEDGSVVRDIRKLLPVSSGSEGNAYFCQLCVEYFQTLVSLTDHLSGFSHKDKKSRCVSRRKKKLITAKTSEEDVALRQFSNVGYLKSHYIALKPSETAASATVEIRQLLINVLNTYRTSQIEANRPDLQVSKPLCAGPWLKNIAINMKNGLAEGAHVSVCAEGLPSHTLLDHLCEFVRDKLMNMKHDNDAAQDPVAGVAYTVERTGASVRVTELHKKVHADLLLLSNPHTSAKGGLSGDVLAECQQNYINTQRDIWMSLRLKRYTQTHSEVVRDLIRFIRWHTHCEERWTALGSWPTEVLCVNVFDTYIQLPEVASTLLGLFEGANRDALLLRLAGEVYKRAAAGAFLPSSRAKLVDPLGDGLRDVASSLSFQTRGDAMSVAQSLVRQHSLDSKFWQHLAAFAPRC